MRINKVGSKKHKVEAVGVSGFAENIDSCAV
jgi:hypothetical protein